MSTRPVLTKLTWDSNKQILMTPACLLESTRLALRDFDNDSEEYGDTPEKVLAAALHGIAKILIADTQEQKHIAAEDLRRELILEFGEREREESHESR